MTPMGRQRNELCLRCGYVSKTGGYPAKLSFLKLSGRSTRGVIGFFPFFKPSHTWQGYSPNAKNQWPLRRLGCFTSTKSVEVVMNESSWLYNIYIYEYKCLYNPTKSLLLIMEPRFSTHFTAMPRNQSCGPLLAAATQCPSHPRGEDAFVASSMGPTGQNPWESLRILRVIMVICYDIANLLELTRMINQTWLWYSQPWLTRHQLWYHDIANTSQP